jgi:hypothetical protein
LPIANVLEHAHKKPRSAKLKVACAQSADLTGVLMRRITVALLAAVTAVIGVLVESASGHLKWVAVAVYAVASALAAVSALPQETRDSRKTPSQNPGDGQPRTSREAKKARKDSGGTWYDAQPPPAREPAASREPRRPRAGYPAIPRRGWNVAAFLWPMVTSIFGFIGLIMALFRARDRTLRANSALSVELWITLFAAILLQDPADYYYHTHPLAFRVIGAFSDVTSAATAILIIYCIIRVSGHRQPVIAGYTRAAFWLADRKS